MQKMVHKTIRVEKELWDKFKKIAKYKDSDASKEIRKFIIPPKNTPSKIN